MKVKRQRKNGRSRPNQKRKWLTIGLLVAALLLAGVSLYGYMASASAGISAVGYAPEEVVGDQPILAGHDMNDGPPIPFLPPNQPQPNIQMSDSFYDFGAIGPQDVVTREFLIRNTGETPLTISRAYTTCGCTTAKISASVIPPGKAATVQLMFDAGFHDAVGQTVRRGLIIENNDPGQSQAEIWVQATVQTR